MSIEIDRSKWSPSSQRSGGHYDECAIYYENLAYRCRKCEMSCVFTAEQQKEAYEERKEYVWRIPSLCPSCETQRNLLRAEVKECQEAWNCKREVLSKNRNFLEQWRLILREIETYGRKGSSPSNVIMISKLLSKNE